MFSKKSAAALAAAFCVFGCLEVSAAQGAGAETTATVAIQKKPDKPKVSPPTDRVWFGLGAKGGGGADAGVGAQLALTYLRSDGMVFRLQHHGLIVDERGPDESDDNSDCFFFECMFEAFTFDPDLAAVTETGVLVGRRLDPDSRWFAAVGVARQAYSDNRNADSRDEVGVGVPVILGWSSALKRSGVGFEFDISASAGEVSHQIGAQFSLTFGGRNR